MTEETKKEILAEILRKGNIGQLIIENNAEVIYNKNSEKDETPIVKPVDVDFEPIETAEKGESLAESLKGAFFGDANVAQKFLNEISGLKPPQVSEIVCGYIKRKQLSELSSHRDLWKVLHDNGYYEPSESNWNKALKLL